MRFQLACAQIAPRKADVAGNLDRIVDIALHAQASGADVVLFPETSTSGYFLEGGVLEASLTSDQLVEELDKRFKGRIERTLDIALGYYQNAQGNLYNAVSYLQCDPGGITRIADYRKFFLPTYGVFDEERFVSRGRDLGVFNTRFGRFGFLVCEDIWHSIMPTLCALSGAQLLLVPSASPARGFKGPQVESLARYRRIMVAAAEEHGIWCANCQLCGFEGGKGLVGGSCIVDPFGKILGESPIADEHILLSEIDLDMVTISRSSSPLLTDLESAWGDILRIIKKEIQK